MNRFLARTTILATFALSNVANGQSGRMTAADYDRAVNFLGPNLTGLVIGGSVTANWLPDGRFWYRAQTQTGSEFRLVSPAAKRMAPAFDHQRLSTALGSASGTAVNATALPFQSITFSTRMDSVSFDVGERRFRCDVGGQRLRCRGQRHRRWRSRWSRGRRRWWWSRQRRANARDVARR